MYSIEFFYSITFIPRKNTIIIIIIILFISYIRVVYNNKVCTKTTKTIIMLWLTVQLHDCQIHYYLICIILAYSIHSGDDISIFFSLRMCTYVFLRNGVRHILLAFCSH